MPFNPPVWVTRNALKEKKKVLLAAGLFVAGGIVAAVMHRPRESTDNATVDARTTAISPRISGVASEVLVADNTLVEKDQIIAKLDPAPEHAIVEEARAALLVQQAALARAKVDLDTAMLSTGAHLDSTRAEERQAEAAARSAQAGVSRMTAQLTAANARLAQAKAEFDRRSALHEHGATTEEEFEKARLAFEQAEAEARRARADLSGASASRDSALGGVDVANSNLTVATGNRATAAATAEVALQDARVKQAEATLARAELDLSFTEIRAPSKGWVTRRSVEVGQSVTPDMLLFAIVAPDDVWVDANFKESQIAAIRPGQRAEIFVDAYDRTFPAQVESIAPVSASRFSLLPAENASGNFVKVVQRLAVRVRFQNPPTELMRPGMSATVTVFTK